MAAPAAWRGRVRGPRAPGCPEKQYGKHSHQCPLTELRKIAGTVDLTVDRHAQCDQKDFPSVSPGFQSEDSPAKQCRGEEKFSCHVMSDFPGRRLQFRDRAGSDGGSWMKAVVWKRSARSKACMVSS